MANTTVWKAGVQELHAKRGKTPIDPNVEIVDCRLPCDTFNVVCRARLAQHTA